MNQGIAKVLLVFCALTATLGTLFLINRSDTARQATMVDALVEAQTGGYRIITTDGVWQKFRSNRDDLLLIDTRQEWEYSIGHIPGAINFPMEPGWFSEWQEKGALAKLLGPNKNRFMVFY